MSHFTVLVIGEDYENQLAPYHEFECTGVNDEHVQTIDETEEARSRYEEYKDDENYPTFAAFLEGYYGRNTVPEGEEPDLEGDHKYGYTVLNKDGEVVATYDRTNPNAKWDWYLVGGRWTGFFKLKAGAKGESGSPGIMTAPAPAGRADRARICDIDIEGMRDEAETKARATFAMWRECFEGSDTLPESWDTIRTRYEGDIDKAREVYNNQPAIKAFHEKRVSLFANPVVDYGFDEEAFVAKQRDNALVTFAVVKDGEWFERGNMGWWGIVTDKKDSDDWLRMFNEYLDGLDPETYLTIVDCHI